MKICIYGAGSIGCYIGGRLAAAGADVTFITRPRTYTELSHVGLRLTDYLAHDIRVVPQLLKLSLEPTAVKDADIIFVCVKSSATEQVALELLENLGNHSPYIVSFQNGLSNVPILKKVLQQLRVIEGMVPFNVANLGQGHFHQGTSGAIHIKQFLAQDQLLDIFKKAQLEIMFDEDMLSVQWAKILLNLNNSINALSKLPLKQQLSIHKYRQCLAMAQRETLDLLKLAQIHPAKLTAISAQHVPKILELPDFIFKILSKKMLDIDPLARSSMQDDLLAGRKTEIDWINGEVVLLAQRLGKRAPINECLIKLIKQAEVSATEFSMDADSLKKQLENELK
jgi:2-dehydropantoate 2-reductase